MLDDGQDGSFIDGLSARWIKLLIRRIFMIAQQEDDRLLLRGLQRHLKLHCPNRLPAMGDGVAQGSPLHSQGRIPSPIGTQESISVSIEALPFLRACKKGKMVTSLAVFRLVIDHSINNLNLTDRVIALEIGCIIHRIPQTELKRGKDR